MASSLGASTTTFTGVVVSLFFSFCLLFGKFTFTESERSPSVYEKWLAAGSPQRPYS